MGGCTLTVIRDTKDEVIRNITDQLIIAARSGLFPDSELVVLQEGAESAEIYKCHLEHEDTIPVSFPYSLRLETVEEGRLFHVGVAARYNRTLQPGEWVATVHVHS